MLITLARATDANVSASKSVSPTSPSSFGRVLTLCSESTDFAMRKQDKSLEIKDLRRGRESNPRIEVLQTSALPLGYPAECESELSFGIKRCQPSSSANRCVLMPNCSWNAFARCRSSGRSESFADLVAIINRFLAVCSGSTNSWRRVV